MVDATSSSTRLFRLHRPDASRVEISGTFTGWDETPIALDPSGDGWWTIELELPVGDHEFQYLIDRSTRLADYAANGVRLNSFGQWVSLLTVEPIPQPVAPAPEKTRAKVTVVGRIGASSETPAKAA
jgi:hypothetical protein